jgi:acetyl esterase/lipase
MKEVSRRDFVQRAVAAGIALGAAPTLLRATPRPAWPQPSAGSSDPYAMVDPELVSTLKTFKTKSFNQELLAVERAQPSFPALPPPAPQFKERHIPGPAGAPEVRILTLDPSPGIRGRPAFLHIHGGGYIAGHAAQFPEFLQTAAITCNCVVVSVDYRRAPETHFPGSLEDNYAALRWLYNNADALGVDRNRIAIGGESAGGGHSAALAIAARDRREIPIIFQLLIYPMLDDRTGSTRPVSPGIGEFVWNSTSNRFGWTSLLGVPAGSTDVPPGSVPARISSVAGLPPTFISVGALDLFVEEDIEYARRLINAGVPTELHVIPGAFHGYDLLVPQAAPSRRFTESWKAALSRAYANV